MQTAAVATASGTASVPPAHCHAHGAITANRLMTAGKEPQQLHASQSVQTATAEWQAAVAAAELKAAYHAARLPFDCDTSRAAGSMAPLPLPLEDDRRPAVPLPPLLCGTPVRVRQDVRQDARAQQGPTLQAPILQGPNLHTELPHRAVAASVFQRLSGGDTPAHAPRPKTHGHGRGSGRVLSSSSLETLAPVTPPAAAPAHAPAGLTSGPNPTLDASSAATAVGSLTVLAQLQQQLLCAHHDRTAAGIQTAVPGLLDPLLLPQLLALQSVTTPMPTPAIGSLQKPESDTGFPQQQIDTILPQRGLDAGAQQAVQQWQQLQAQQQCLAAAQWLAAAAGDPKIASPLARWSVPSLDQPTLGQSTLGLATSTGRPLASLAGMPALPGTAFLQQLSQVPQLACPSLLSQDLMHASQRNKFADGVLNLADHRQTEHDIRSGVAKAIAASQELFAAQQQKGRHWQGPVLPSRSPPRFKTQSSHNPGPGGP